MKKQAKKLFAILLVAVMTLSLSVSAFAATSIDRVPLTEETKGVIRIVGAETGDEFAVYPVTNLNYAESSNSLTYEPDANFSAFLVSAGNTSGITSFSAYQSLASESGELKKVLGQYTRYCVANGVSPAYTITGSSFEVADVNLGQYVLYGTSVTSKNVFASMTATHNVSVNGNGEYEVNTLALVFAKKTTPEITKSLQNENDQQVAYGDTIEYEIISTVPQYPEDAVHTTYRVGDTVSVGGLLLDTSTFTVVATAVADDWTSPVTLTAGVDYEEETMSESGFRIAFTYDRIKGFKQIKITYNTEVNFKNQWFTMRDFAKNTAKLDFSTKPYEETDFTQEDESTVVSYTYRIYARKVDASDPDKVLAGVEFEVYKQGETTPLTFSALQDGENGYDPNGTITTLKTNPYGALMLVGLDVGTYEFKEIKTVAGYALPEAPFTVTISDADIDGMVDDAEHNNTIVEATFTNVKNDGTLPQTGGTGTFVFVLIGLGIMGLTVASFAMVSRKARYNQ